MCRSALPAAACSLVSTACLPDAARLAFGQPQHLRLPPPSVPAGFLPASKAAEQVVHLLDTLQKPTSCFLYFMQGAGAE